MSFRELRNFCEVMRSLGYPRLVSCENFRTPNFELVADILHWLIHRFEPNSHIPDDITTEANRVEFVKVCAERVVIRTSIKLNTRKLYGADGYAVKELLKLAMVLYEAQQSLGDSHDTGLDESFTLNSKISDLKSTRSLCSTIIESGANLFDLLQKEAGVLRPQREKSLRFLDGISRNLESNTEHDMIERAVGGMLSRQGQNLEQLVNMTEALQKDEKALEAKLKKKKQELERCTKRLGNLSSVRPAFMDEYEKLEGELERYYEQYVGRFRNLDYLEHELDTLNREEKERMEENERALKRMQKRLREEEWRMLRGEDDASEFKDPKEPKARGAGGKRSASRAGDVYGGMDGGSDEEASDDESGSGSEDPRISVGNSGSEDAPVSLGGANGGGSASEDDILNESDDDDFSDEDAIPSVSRGHGKAMTSDHDF